MAAERDMHEPFEHQAWDEIPGSRQRPEIFHADVITKLGHRLREWSASLTPAQFSHADDAEQLKLRGLDDESLFDLLYGSSVDEWNANPPLFSAALKELMRRDLLLPPPPDEKNA